MPGDILLTVRLVGQDTKGSGMLGPVRHGSINSSTGRSSSVPIERRRSPLPFADISDLGRALLLALWSATVRPPREWDQRSRRSAALSPLPPGRWKAAPSPPAGPALPRMAGQGRPPRRRLPEAAGAADGGSGTRQARPRAGTTVDRATCPRVGWPLEDRESGSSIRGSDWALTGPSPAEDTRSRVSRPRPRCHRDEALGLWLGGSDRPRLHAGVPTAAFEVRCRTAARLDALNPLIAPN
eukprot:scaffold1106_cov608-Prasinococcus_capsulatus_cf.AAC.6